MSVLRKTLKYIGLLDYSKSYIKSIASKYLKHQLENNTDLIPIFNDIDNLNIINKHHGYLEYKDEAIIIHLKIQLANIIFEVKNLLRAHDSSYNESFFLDAGDPDRLILNSMKIKKGISFNIMDYCVKQAKKGGGNPVLGDLQFLPFDDSSFDYGFCFETLEHLENPMFGLKELSRVTKKKIYISIPWVEKTRIYQDNYMPNEPEVENHIFEFDHQDFQKIVSHTDLKITYFKELNTFPKISNPIDKFLLEKFYFPSYFPKLQFYELSKV